LLVAKNDPRIGEFYEEVAVVVMLNKLLVKVVNLITRTGEFVYTATTLVFC
jgi:hypothetical protein